MSSKAYGEFVIDDEGGGGRRRVTTGLQQPYQDETGAWIYPRVHGPTGLIIWGPIPDPLVVPLEESLPGYVQPTSSRVPPTYTPPLIDPRGRTVTPPRPRVPPAAPLPPAASAALLPAALAAALFLLR